MDQREVWIAAATRLAEPVLTNLARRELRLRMPVEHAPGVADRKTVTYLEALGRLLTGIAPWLELGADPAARRFAELAREGLDAATDPASPDYMNFCQGGQPVVDAAFLSQAILRAPKALWKPLPERVKGQVLAALRSTRVIQPGFNNWLLFSATVEAALLTCGAPDWDRMRIDYAIRQHEQWYKGDGHYGDGPSFHADYYNAFVIQPMLVDVLRATVPHGKWVDFEERIMKRAVRYAEVQERLISPEGTFPPVGRSLAYRFGALQGLAQMALLKRLPEGVSPAQVREALSAVITRMINAPGTFDDAGWLKIGFCGAQPSIGEPYISTGSVYLCSVGLLPLGLPADDEFWNAPPAAWTAAKAWSGVDLPVDHAIYD